MKVYFWQRLYSHLRSSLVCSLSDFGFSVTFVTEKTTSRERESLGWEAPSSSGVDLVIVKDLDDCIKIIEASSEDSFHLVGGFRKNGVFEEVFKKLTERRLNVFLMMETVDNSGLQGFLRKLVYSRFLRKNSCRLSGILATGATTKNWLENLGVEPNKVFPFTYFLHQPVVDPNFWCGLERTPRFRFAFVGQFIPRKDLNLLLAALGRVKEEDFELVVAGSGPLEDELRSTAERLIPGKYHWKGVLPNHQIGSLLASVDCLVLPSRFDGWGAVVTEALMVGTPAVCSDACGAAEAVRASGVGGVFHAGDEADLVNQLHRVLTNGRVDEGLRSSLSEWSKNFSGLAGAGYLAQIFSYVRRSGEFPIPPWRRSHPMM